MVVWRTVDNCIEMGKDDDLPKQELECQSEASFYNTYLILTTFAFIVDIALLFLCFKMKPTSFNRRTLVVQTIGHAFGFFGLVTFTDYTKRPFVVWEHESKTVQQVFIFISYGYMILKVRNLQGPIKPSLPWIILLPIFALLGFNTG